MSNRNYAIYTKSFVNYLNLSASKLYDFFSKVKEDTKGNYGYFMGIVRS